MNGRVCHCRSNSCLFFLPLFGLFRLKSALNTYLASSARVNSMMARALLTSKFVIMDRNFLSSAVEGTFSCTATQIFRLAAWGLQILSDLSAVSGYDTTDYHFLKNINPWLSVGSLTSDGGDVGPVKQVDNINQCQCLHKASFISSVQLFLVGKINWKILWNIDQYFTWKVSGGTTRANSSNLDLSDSDCSKPHQCRNSLSTQGL